MNNVVPLSPGDKVKIFSSYLQGRTANADNDYYMNMLTNRNPLIIKLNLITMPKQTIKAE